MHGVSLSICRAWHPIRAAIHIWTITPVASDCGMSWAGRFMYPLLGLSCRMPPSQFTCLWEVTWEGDETVEHFTFWSPSNAPVLAASYAAVVHTLFEVIAQALGFRSKHTYRVL